MMDPSSLENAATPLDTQLRAYFEALPVNTRQHLETLRQAIRAAAPGATETFGYGMPAFALDGKAFIWYAAWKHHLSLYPLSKATRQAFAADLAAYETKGQGTLRFRLDQPLPIPLVERLIQARLAEWQKKQKPSRPARDQEPGA